MDNTLKRRVVSFGLLLLWGVLLGIVIRDHYQLIAARFSSLSEKPATALQFDIKFLHVPPGPQRGSFYFDTGRGFNSGEVVVFPYTQPADGKFKHYSVILPPREKIRRLRFDPFDGPGKLIVKDMTVHCYKDKRVMFSQEGANSRKNNSIGSITVQGTAMTITAIAGDPYFILVNDFSAYQKK